MYVHPCLHSVCVCSCCRHFRCCPSSPQCASALSSGTTSRLGRISSEFSSLEYEDRICQVKAGLWCSSTCHLKDGCCLFHCKKTTKPQQTQNWSYRYQNPEWAVFPPQMALWFLSKQQLVNLASHPKHANGSWVMSFSVPHLHSAAFWWELPYKSTEQSFRKLGKEMKQWETKYLKASAASDSMLSMGCSLERIIVKQINPIRQPTQRAPLIAQPLAATHRE